jgi:hypothetical protein
MMMNPDLLTCRRLTAALLYNPISFSRNDLAMLFSSFSERFDVSALVYLPDGARFSQGDTEVLVQQGRTQVTLAFHSHFPGLKEKAVEAMRLVADRFNIREFTAFGVKLIAFLPTEGSAAELLEKNLLGGSPAWLAVLGPGRTGTGFRFNFQREAVYDLRIEPYFMDLSQIYIELDINSHQPFTALDDIAPQMGRAYDYLLGDVREFLGGLRN